MNRFSNLIRAFGVMYLMLIIFAFVFEGSNNRLKKEINQGEPYITGHELGKELRNACSYGGSFYGFFLFMLIYEKRKSENSNELSKPGLFGL